MHPLSIQASVSLRGGSPTAVDYNDLVQALHAWRPNRPRQRRPKRTNPVLMLEGAEPEHRSREFEIIAYRTAEQPVSFTYLTKPKANFNWPNGTQQTQNPFKTLLAKMDRHTPKQRQAGIHFTLKIDTESVVFDVVEHARETTRPGPPKSRRPPLKRLQGLPGPRSVIKPTGHPTSFGSDTNKAMPIFGNMMNLSMRPRK